MADGAGRDDAYDIVKGVLVTAMVVYHVMNAVTTASDEAYGYVRFVSGSFIFVTGLMLSRFVAASFQRDRAATGRRLVVRGIKLVLLFTVLNVFIHASGFGSPAKAQLGLTEFLARAEAVYLRGANQVASFTILLPIGYLMICAPLLLRVLTPDRRAASFVLLGFVLAAAALPSSARGSAIVEFMVVGFVGGCIGTWTNRAPDSAVHPWKGAIAVVGLLASIWLVAQVYSNLALYAIGVALVIRFLHQAATGISANGRVGAVMILLGRYSLFAYIAQIGIIQVLARAMGRPSWPLGPEPALYALAAWTLVVAATVTVARARERSARADVAYRLVFA
jgi:hypothetical protein